MPDFFKFLRKYNEELREKLESDLNAMDEESEDDYYEFCPKCEANLTLQKGFDPSVPRWICKGCGEMLINPAAENDSCVTWFCDKCGDILNDQTGFTEKYGEWKCRECGFKNKINIREVYLSEDEYEAEKKNPLRGLSDEDILKLSLYQETEEIEGCDHVSIVTDPETDKCYVRKYLNFYDRSVYDFLKDHPIAHIPKIVDVYESENSLIVIEEFISGKTVDELMESGNLDKNKALYVAKEVCRILAELNSLDKPIVHRDIKPSNIMINDESEVYLIDINAAKWMNENEKEDTRMIGSRNYAAPEQYGFGFNASTDKTDIYALGMLLNKMLTGKFPKEEMASEPFKSIIEKCISYEQSDRYDAQELLSELEKAEV